MRYVSRLKGGTYAGLVEPFDKDDYIRNLSVAENLLFGTAARQAVRRRQHRGRSLRAARCCRPPASISTCSAWASSIAETMVELFSGLSPDNPLFEQYSFISADELPNVRLLLQRLGGKGIEAVPEADRTRLMTLPFRYIEARHRLGLIDADMEERILAGAAQLRRGPAREPAEVPSSSTISSRYNSAATLQDNILFGRLVYGQAQG